MPPEWAPHERCWMAWPFREDLWRDLDAVRRAYADVARAIRRFEPVTMVAHPDHTASAAGYCGSEIDVVPIVIDDSWTSDSGPHSKALKENLAALERATDARGRSFELIPIEEAHDVEGEGDIFCRSYVNFYIANGGVVAPAYGTAADERVRELLSGLYPGREVSLVDISAIAPGGGGIHCITQQQPTV